MLRKSVCRNMSMLHFIPLFKADDSIAGSQRSRWARLAILTCLHLSSHACKEMNIDEY